MSSLGHTLQLSQTPHYFRLYCDILGLHWYKCARQQLVSEAVSDFEYHHSFYKVQSVLNNDPKAYCSNTEKGQRTQKLMVKGKHLRQNLEISWRRQSSQLVIRQIQCLNINSYSLALSGAFL